MNDVCGVSDKTMLKRKEDSNNDHHRKDCAEKCKAVSEKKKGRKGKETNHI